MEKISRFVHQGKQAKILVLTVQSVRFDVAGPYRSYDRTDDGWLTVGKSGVDMCLLDSEWNEDTWTNLEAPRVTHCLVYGCM